MNLHGPPVDSIMLRSRTFRKQRHRNASCTSCACDAPSRKAFALCLFTRILKASDPPQTVKHNPSLQVFLFFYQPKRWTTCAPDPKGSGREMRTSSGYSSCLVAQGYCHMRLRCKIESFCSPGFVMRSLPHSTGGYTVLPQSRPRCSAVTGTHEPASFFPSVP